MCDDGDECECECECVCGAAVEAGQLLTLGGHDVTVWVWYSTWAMGIRED
jgi:hypothetical protein